MNNERQVPGGWEVLTFLSLHGVSLTSGGRIKCLIEYDNTVSGGALGLLERALTIDGARPFRGMSFYRI
jgi:hypothetical protein